MCGIIGYVGNEKATKILLDGLSSLEYRGYDSAGLSVLNDEKITVKKCVGRVKNLRELDGVNELQGDIGIAHTRWATHGKPSDINSHPHQDNSKKFSVVHNGIIENFEELKEFLSDKGYTFVSETDTEVIPNLIHYYYHELNQCISNKERFLKATKSAIDDLKGSYALAIMSTNFEDGIIVTRKSAPLVVGTSDDANYVASDIPAVLKYTRKFYLLDDSEIALVMKNTIEFYGDDLVPHNKGVKDIEWDAASAEKGGFEDYMLKEIFEQPTAVRETIGTRLPYGRPCDIPELKFSKEYLKSLNKIYIVACGTAMHAALAAKGTFEKLCGILCVVEVASEFRYRNPLIDKKTLCIYISQSGETADTIAALQLASSRKAKTVAITNVIGSSITREADYSLYTHAGPEIAVASTKAYTSQVVLMTILAMQFAEIMETYPKEEITKIKEEIMDLPSKIESILDEKETLKEFASNIYTEHDIYFLGRGVDYTTALEASLKLKEISYIHSDAYASGELKHGPIALIEKGVTVIGIITDENLVEKSMNNVLEVITRGAKTFIITNKLLKKNNFNYVLNIPDTSSILSPILSIIPLQLLSYYVAKYKGLDVDKPRNLAKSVTVE